MFNYKNQKKEGSLMKYRKLEDYEYENLRKGLLYINKYDLSLMSIWELNTYWKEFGFDIINKLMRTPEDFIIPKVDLLDYIKNNYDNIIKKYRLNIDIEDYVEIMDYVSYNDWIKENDIAHVKSGKYLIKSE